MSLERVYFLLELESHTFAGKAPVQKEGFRQGAKPKQKNNPETETFLYWEQLNHTIQPQVSNELLALLKLKTWPWHH